MMDPKRFDDFREETRDKFDSLERRLIRIDSKLDQLADFKVGMRVSSKWIAFIVSGLCGLLSVAASVWATLHVVGK